MAENLEREDCQQPLNRRGKLVVLSVHEHHRGIHPSLNETALEKLTSEATGISVSSIQRFKKEAREGSVSSPPKKRPRISPVVNSDRIVSTGYVINGSPLNADPSKAPLDDGPPPGAPKCHILCNNVTQPLTWDDLESQKVVDRIKHQYYVHLILDNLPCATKFKSVDTGENVYERGYRLGFVLDDHVYVNNHLHMRIYYNPHDKDAHGRDGYSHGGDKNAHDEGFTIVRFEVEPSSVDLSQIKSVGNNECSFPDKHTPQEVKTTGTKLLFTYSVEWVESNVPWASRWDIYLQMSDVQIHWFSIVNSLVVVFFLSGILTMIIIRTLRRDIARYNAEETLEETLEESGWKLVHGDVFRPPRHPKLFSAVIGSGVQIFLMVFATVVLAMLGLLSPSSRGALMTTGILIYAVMGSGAGYFSTRLYLTLKGHYNWWWRSVVTSGGSALYVFLYSVFYLYTKLEITEGVSLVLYFGYTMAMVMTFWVMTGAVGFYAAYVFIRNIYSAVKID
ncbi:hypothetical protein Pcinc_003289 [Petrolisthes cinctipes]|uniref:Transmembrane 9 superfamily member n=1 Tax=Petrolisthes cinctipes TaxID=88211 RepID=A0AAE1GGM1_PETCI|nr:hypothetical protein Pcinc_003289 [Petrolisthes cinctipes]